jgi:hypothetical protein
VESETRRQGRGKEGEGGGHRSAEHGEASRRGAQRGVTPPRRRGSEARRVECGADADSSSSAARAASSAADARKHTIQILILAAAVRAGRTLHMRPSAEPRRPVNHHAAAAPGRARCLAVPQRAGGATTSGPGARGAAPRVRAARPRCRMAAAAAFALPASRRRLRAAAHPCCAARTPSRRLALCVFTHTRGAEPRLLTRDAAGKMRDEERSEGARSSAGMRE